MCSYASLSSEDDQLPRPLVAQHTSLVFPQVTASQRIHCSTCGYYIKEDVLCKYHRVNTLAPIPENAEHVDGTPMSEAEAKAIADRFLSAKYPRFSEMHFDKVTIHLVDTPELTRRTPYYNIGYFITVTDDGWVEDLVQYGISIHAIDGEIQTWSGPGEGAG